IQLQDNILSQEAYPTTTLLHEDMGFTFEPETINTSQINNFRTLAREAYDAAAHRIFQYKDPTLQDTLKDLQQFHKMMLELDELEALLDTHIRVPFQYQVAPGDP